MTAYTIVTGAAGFIGRNLVHALNQRGHDRLLLVDRLGTDEKWQNLLGLHFEDVLDPDALLRRLDHGSAPRIDALFHLGACSATTERDADFLLENNYRFTRTLCQWCLRQDARFVYASSAATYGDGSLGYADDDRVTPTLKPLNMYGYSKHLFDLWALRHHLFDRIVGLKYFNVFGPYEQHKADMRSVVHKAYHQIKTTGEATLFKSHRPDYEHGQQKRDFVFVRDAVDVTLHFAEHRDTGGLFNCGTGTAHTWLDLATALFDALGLPPNIRFVDMPDALRDKYQYFTEADATKLRAAGYTAPFTPLADGVRQTVEHLEAQA